MWTYNKVLEYPINIKILIYQKDDSFLRLRSFLCVYFKFYKIVLLFGIPIMNIKFNKKEKQIFINRYLSGVLIESITADIGIVHSTLYSLINNLKKK